MKSPILLVGSLLTLAVAPVAAQVTIVLSPDSCEGKDALIADCPPLGYNNMNFGSHTDFIAIAWTNGGNPVNGRGLVQFDLSQIPVGSTIVSASLSLHHNPTSTSNTGHSQLSGSNEAWLRRITSNWNESSVTWNTMPAVTTQNQILLPASTSNTQDYLNINVASLVQDMVNNPTQSFGFMMELQNETYYRSLLFASSDHTNPLLHPTLEVTYLPAPGQICLVMQPGNSACENGKDAMIADCVPCGYDNQNFGNATDFLAIAWTNGGNTSNGRGLLEFDLSAIPTGSLINSAYLSLYHNNTSTANTGHSQLSGSNESVLSRITSPWSEMTVTWNTQPSTTSVNQVILPASTSNTQDYPNIDVTALLQDMVDNPSQSHGFMLQLVTESYYRSMLFSSSDHADASKHPKLEVCFTPATGLSEVANGSAFSYYPNPMIAGGQLTVTSPGAGTTLEITDDLGRLIYTSKIHQETAVISLPRLAAGIYGVRLLYGTASHAGKLVIATPAE